MRSSLSTYLIGRSQKADIVIGDITVSRLHAELVRGRDRRWFLTDRSSTGGSYIWYEGKWKPVRQEFVRSGDRLKFGAFECSLDDLLHQLSHTGESKSESQGGETGTGTPILDDRPQGPVRRSPTTGDVIARKDEW